MKEWFVSYVVCGNYEGEHKEENLKNQFSIIHVYLQSSQEWMDNSKLFLEYNIFFTEDIKISC